MIFAKDKNSQIDFVNLSKKLVFGIGQPLVEIFYGIRKDTITYWPLLVWGLAFDVLLLSHCDREIFKLLKISWLYPRNPIAYSIYAFIGVTFGFWCWGLVQALKRTKMINRLTEVFQESGLKSPMGKLPSFIFDVPVDELVRRLRITNAFMPKAKFEEAREKLESGLQVYIDEISESKSGGTIDILYSHYEISKLVELKDIKSIGENQFFIGQTRAKPTYGSLQSTPHLLIGGQTGGGKSTFLRQLITTLYCNNKEYSFTLIDMKGGLEFQLFDNRKRIKVISNPSDVSGLFAKLDELLDERFEILKANQCKDIDDFHKKPIESLKLPKGLDPEKYKVGRHIIIIDEVAELFLAGGKITVSHVQDITRKAIRIAAQGRAVGIHLIVATQKPDSKALSTHIKANLPGIVSFPMATLGASFSILGNGRAKELPSTPGRAIWKSGLDYFELQTPFISPEQAKAELDKISPIKEEDGKN